MNWTRKTRKRIEALRTALWRFAIQMSACRRGRHWYRTIAQTQDTHEPVIQVCRGCGFPRARVMLRVKRGTVVVAHKNSGEEVTYQEGTYTTDLWRTRTRIPARWSVDRLEVELAIDEQRREMGITEEDGALEWTQ